MINIKNAQGINKVEESARNKKRVEDYFNLYPDNSKAQACRDLNLSRPTLDRHIRSIIREMELPNNEKLNRENFDGKGFAELFISRLEPAKVEELKSLFSKSGVLYSDAFLGIDLDSFCLDDNNTEHFAKAEGVLWYPNDIKMILEENVFDILTKKDG